MPMLALFLAAQPVQQADPIKLFDDWTVACDNGHRCEMTSLFPGDQPAPDEDSGFDASLSVTRLPGPAGGFTVDFSAYHTLKGRLRFQIDGATIATAVAGGEGIRLTGDDAARTVFAMVNGKQAALVDAAGKPVARVSLAGSSAALRYIDADQGRVGTVTAVVAKGSKPAAAVPAAPAPATVAAMRPSGAAATVSKALRAALEKQADCADMYGGGEPVPPVATFALGTGKTLALLPCGSGAYNFSSVAFILSGGKAARAAFDRGDGMLVNASFEKGVLSTFDKGRGLGDCGTSEDYVWDGQRFRLISARAMPECRGSTNWLTYYRATPVFR